MKNIFYFSLFSLLILSCGKQEPETPVVTHLVTFTVEGNGSLNTATGTFTSGESLSIIPTPDEGHYFVGWQGDVSNEDNPLTITVTQDLNITAIFLPIVELSSEVVIYNPLDMDDNNIFIIENGGQLAYLVDKTGTRLQSWNFELNFGNDVELLSDGSIIALFKPRTTEIGFGGYGGVLRKFDPSGTLVWEYELNTENFLLHHDFLILPNDNIIVLVWERIPFDEATAQGFPRTTDIFTEKLIEINPNTNEVVWEWRSWEHKVQDLDSEAPNFGNVTEQFQKIDLNYNSNENGDIMHANGIEYDPVKKLLYMSVNFYSEVWVIDHDLTTEDAQGSAGDLKYRFGNPSAYKGSGSRLFYNNHHPNLVTLHPESQGNFMLYMNGTEEEQSVAFEFALPDSFVNQDGVLNDPQIVWSYTHPDLFYGKLSGVIRLANGNTLICEGDYGYWEVTPDKRVVWKYEGTTTYWRGYSIPVN